MSTPAQNTKPRKEHILLLDDDQAFIHTHHTLLEKIGHYRVTEIHSTDELLVELKQTNSVDLILMGLHPYGLNALEICKKIKTNSQLEHLPIIILTHSEDVQKLVDAYSSGIHDFIRKPVNLDELLARINSALFLKRKLLKQKEREAELVNLTHQLMLEKYDLEQMAFTDALTDLGNRRAFEESFINLWLNSYLKNDTMGVLIAEVLDFKEYNDTYGQQYGDQCLKDIAKALESELHSSQILTRLGGKEFCVLIPQADAQTLLELGQNLCTKIKGLHINHSSSSHGPNISINVGGALVLPQKTDKETRTLILSKANQALDMARNMGANQVKLIEFQSNELLIH